jgi:hypothetical protein
MPKPAHEFEHCYYCGATLLEGSFQRDHFPIPERAGGTLTVPACLPCHDMKDRLRFDQWNPELIAEMMDDWPKLGRASRLMIAKFLAIHADYVHANGDHPDSRASGGDAARLRGDRGGVHPEPRAASGEDRPGMGADR